MAAAHESRPKSIGELAHEWDLLAEERDRQLRSGIDLSFRYVVAPSAIRLLEAADLSALLDVGCGTGHFAALASKVSASIVGIDPSARSISLAKRACVNENHVRFRCATIEDFAADPGGEMPTAAVALMVMMAAPNIERFAKSVSSVLPCGAVFVTVIPHPCFWPTYWGYAEEPWFDYSKEIYIEAPFVISGSQTEVRTTHIHRPIEKYISALANAGFQLDAFEEPMPSPEVEAMYPAPWAFPRFLASRWIKAR